MSENLYHNCYVNLLELQKNELTIAEFVENRKNFHGEGRSKEATKLQRQFRDDFKRNKIDELMENGLSYKEAKDEVNEFMKSQAVLHDPDQVAGGNPMNFKGFGDKHINSSIGSQWRTNIKGVEEHIMKFASTISKSEWGNVKLNIKLTF